MTAHVDQQDLSWTYRLQFLRQLGNLHSGHDTVARRRMLPVQPDAMGDEGDGGEDDDDFDDVPRCLKSAGDGGNEIAEKVSDREVRERI